MQTTNRSLILRTGFVVSVLAALLCSAGCFHNTHMLTGANDGSIVVADVGDIIRIRLEGNASTGFLWERFEPTELEGTPIEAIAEGGYESDGTAPGSSGIFSFQYAAVRKGTLTLSFAYRRPWEDEPPLDTYSVVVWVP